MIDGESIIDEILYLEREYNFRHRNVPKYLHMHPEDYERLCEERGVEEMETYHGMAVVVSGDFEPGACFLDIYRNGE